MRTGAVSIHLRGSVMLLSIWREGDFFFLPYILVTIIVIKLLYSLITSLFKH